MRDVSLPARFWATDALVRPGPPSPAVSQHVRPLIPSGSSSTSAWIASGRVRKPTNASWRTFAARPGPGADVCEARSDTLEHFLAERYCLFMHDDRRGLGLLDVDHKS
jgi:Uncharacterized conserved protein (COG2071)